MLGALDELTAAQLLRGPPSAQFLTDLGDPASPLVGEGDGVDAPAGGGRLASGELGKGVVEPLRLLVVARPREEEGNHARILAAGTDRTAVRSGRPAATGDAFPRWVTGPGAQHPARRPGRAHAAAERRRPAPR